MTLGNKIKKYRKLHNLTQNALGKLLGFLSSTADSRIRKYEGNYMAPKDDIRNKISNVLDIDIEALSDINISSPEELMHVFFELEESLDMTIEKKDGKTTLVFDDSNTEIKTLISYLNIWNNKKATLPDKDTITNEQRREYLLWKSRFVKNVKEYYDSKKQEIDNMYKPLVYDMSLDYTYATKSSAITLLLRQLVEAGLSITTENVGAGFTFMVNEILNLADTKKMLFTKFLLEYSRMKELGAPCFHEIHLIDKVLTITYYIDIPTFCVITEQVKDFIEYYNNMDSYDDYTKEEFENKFKEDIDTYNVIIEDEINHYQNS